MANQLLYSSWIYNNAFNYKNIIMANREKFLHNFKKANRQRKNEKHLLNNFFNSYSKVLIEIVENNGSK